jgi:DNA-directed RNA polymerase II subunit RPB2
MASDSSLDWSVIDTYVRDTYNFLTSHQIESFHEFVFEKIPYTIKTLNPFTTLKNVDGKVRHEINVFIGGRDGSKVHIGKPTIVENGTQRLLLPNEARLKGMTYASDVFCDILIEYVDHSKNPPEKVEKWLDKTPSKVASIPIMLHSRLCALHMQPTEVLREMGECPYDQGGYFIIDGKEKVIIAQERMVTNRVFVSKSSDPEHFTYEGVVRCTSDENALFPKTIRFFVDSRDRDINRNLVRNQIIVMCPGMCLPISLFTLFRALGVESDHDILECIIGDLSATTAKPLIDFLRASVINGPGENNIYSQDEALAYLASMVEYKNVDSVVNVLLNDILPNMGTSFSKKALFLGYVVKRIIRTALGFAETTDRDNYMFKRVDLSGFLLANLFRDLYNQYRNNVKNTIDSQYYYKLSNDPSLVSFESVKTYINDRNKRIIFKERLIQDALMKSFKGNWGGQETLNAEDGGIVQDLGRLSYLGYVSHVRRLATPLEKGSKIVGPHKLLTSHWGYVCPVESPDGGNIGLIKHLAIMARVTSNQDPSNIKTFIEEFGDLMSLDDVQPYDAASPTLCKIFVNDNWIGMHSDPRSLRDALLTARRNGKIHCMTGISWNVLENELYTRVDAGRCTRPLYVVNNKELAIQDTTLLTNTTWSSLIANGFIEYVDVEESNSSLIAMYKADITTRHTHVEIHPSTSLSMYTNTIPMMHHNPATRATFSGAQGKQAIGVYATNFNNRIDTNSYVLHYPQQALASTKYARMCNVDALPNGENVIVAVACYTGYNMEDSLILNRASIERGMFNVSVFKSYVDKESDNKFSKEKVVFINPNALPEEIDVKSGGNWSKIDEDGFPKVNSYINPGDVFLGRCHVKNAKTDVVDSAAGINLFHESADVATYSDMSVRGSKIKGGTIDKVFTYADEEGLRTAKIRFRKVRTPKLGDKHCLTPDHDVLTTDGWVPIANVTKEHRVCSLINGSIIEYVHPTELFAYDCVDEQMYCIKTQYVDLCTTLNHNMYVKQRGETDYNLMLASDVYEKRVTYKKNAVNNNADYQFVLPSTETYSEKILDMDTLLELIGYWVANDVSKLHDLVSLENPQLGEYLNASCISCLPQWVWNLSTKQCRILFMGLLKDSIGDVYYARSIQLADDIQRLALHAGWVANIIKLGGSRRITYAVKILKINEYDKTGRVHEEKIVNYSGGVYCLEVSSHVFYVRRNGKSVWTGNSSRHGQKGVVGAIMAPEDMPFTADGLVPDIIINPHAIPTRMTIAHLVECIVSKLCCLSGSRIDCTAFDDPDNMETLYDILEKKYNMNRHGDEIMYNGHTGMMMATKVFIGPTYYMRLKHMVEDKINARAGGAISAITHQPIKGRSKGGGLRIGEMETNVLLSHGIASFIKETMLERSDKAKMVLNKDTGALAIENATTKTYKTNQGTIATNVAHIEIPYAWKVVMQELDAFGMTARLMTDDSKIITDEVIDDNILQETYDAEMSDEE